MTEPRKRQREIRGARIIARHSSALVPPPASASELDDTVREFGERVARALAAPLSELLGGRQPQVELAGVKREGASNCVCDSGLAAHFVIGEAAGPFALTASLGGREALMLCDRVFGGTGAVAEPMPGELPMSAELVMKRFGAIVAGAVSRARDGEAEIAVKAHGEKLAKLIPFPRIAECFVIDLTVTEKDKQGWPLRLLADVAGLTAWFGTPARAAPAKAVRRTINHSPGAAPFADIPLPLIAMLAELKLPVSRVARLRVGDTIPLSLRRDVPLSIGTQIIARGTVGTLDDRIAVCLSSGPSGSQHLTRLTNGDQSS